ncbi:MAG: peptidoglycan-binding protein, partial [Candidatus Pacebacteria bacterium]|nr:peptidoglycan-binding protein [Candidatus Paceibacterota bacterium]
HKQSKCEYKNKAIEPIEPIEPPISTAENLFGKEACPSSQIITQNLRAPARARDDLYHKYTKGTLREVKILQLHINRLGFDTLKVDGILGPITNGAIKRMQIFLGTIPDGYVGPKTRELINNSCKRY